MKPDELNNLLNKVKSEGEMFEFTNNDDIASVHFVEPTGIFLFVFNGKGAFSYKSLRHFRNKLMRWIDEKSLKLC